jgi:hypothetical protein
MRWHGNSTILDVAALSRKMGHCESRCTGHHYKEFGIPISCTIFVAVSSPCIELSKRMTPGPCCQVTVCF